jgi:hypothetical protein
VTLVDLHDPVVDDGVADRQERADESIEVSGPDSIVVLGFLPVEELQPSRIRARDVATLLENLRLRYTREWIQVVRRPRKRFDDEMSRPGAASAVIAAFVVDPRRAYFPGVSLA